MLKVHKFGPAFGLPDASPFVIKLETYLRMAGLPYETVNGDVRKAPKRKLPLLEENGKLIADSTVIVDTLEARSDHKLDAHLDAKQRAIGQAYKSMLEEHLYFVILALRWTTDDGWTVFEPTLREMIGRAGVPSMLRGVISKQARKGVIAQAHAQGTGRHNRAEMVAMGSKIVDALAEQIGDGPYFFGDKATTYDATAYAFAAGVLVPAFDNELHKHAKTKKHLVSYEKRMKDKYWAEG
ncbi:MAG TPA: glutathione S-transferase family protein [Polyangiaceae bacterium]|jgi:glutathione S-transferase